MPTNEYANDLSWYLVPFVITNREMYLKDCAVLETIHLAVDELADERTHTLGL